MNKKRLIISSVISIFLVSVLLLGSTYSIFTSQEIDETANVYKTGNLNVTYKVSSNTVHFTDPTPMTIEEADSVIPYRITVTNSGNVPYEFDVILLDITSSTDNTIDYQYIMTKVGYLEPKILSDCTNNIIKENIIVPAGKSVDIDIRIWLDSALSNTEIGKSFYAKLKIDGLAVYNDNEEIDNSSLSLRYMNTPGERSNYYKNELYKTHIKTASFVDYIDTSNASVNTETNEKIIWDMSTSQDKSVIAWLEDTGTNDGNGNKLFNLYIGSKQEIYVKSFESFFRDMTCLETIAFNNLNTSLNTSLRQTFRNCANLLELDVSGFITKNVTRMSYLFSGLSNITYLDVSNFDTSKVTLMDYMFSRCSNLINLDVSNFDTANVNDMEFMFSNCSSLIELDVSNFDTANVNDMNSMFSNCSSLIELDVSNWNTSNVENMRMLFNGCSSLTSVDVANFNTENVTNMAAMFANCSSLTSLDVSNFDTSGVTLFGNSNGGMFQCCSSLTSLDVSNFDTSNATSMRWMFQNCNELTTTITIKKNNVTEYRNMFSDAATTEGAQIIVNYVGDDITTTDVNESTEALVDAMIATKSTNSNVVKGELVA